MACCPRREHCAFLQDEMYQKMTRLLQQFQESYCQGRFTECACYKIASELGDSFVPSLMMPAQIEWAEQIIEENKPVLQVR